MLKALKIAGLSFAALVLSTSFVLAQAPQPTPDPGQPPATSKPASHKSKTKKAGKKKTAKKKAKKATTPAH